jgi:hypothetical protein
MSSACYALRYVKHSLPIETLKIIYFVATPLMLIRYSYCKRKLLELLLMLDQGTLVGKCLGTCRY